MTSKIDSDVKVLFTVYILTTSTVLEIRFEPDGVVLNTPMDSSVRTDSLDLVCLGRERSHRRKLLIPDVDIT